MLWIILLVLLILALGGGWGYDRYGPWGFSPLGIVLIIVIILLLTGNIVL